MFCDMLICIVSQSKNADIPQSRRNPTVTLIQAEGGLLLGYQSSIDGWCTDWAVQWHCCLNSLSFSRAVNMSDGEMRRAVLAIFSRHFTDIFKERKKPNGPNSHHPPYPSPYSPTSRLAHPFVCSDSWVAPMFLSVSVGLDLFQCNVHAMQCKWSCHSRRPNHYGRTTLTSRQQGGRQCVHQTLASYRRQIGQLASVAK